MNISLNNILNNVLKYVYYKFLRSVPSKILIIFGIISFILSFISKDSNHLIFSQILVYLYFASIANCMIYGDCFYSACFLIIIPILTSSIIILDKVGYFNDLKLKLEKILRYLKKNEIIIPNQ